jgi:hypothetical protein
MQKKLFVAPLLGLMFMGAVGASAATITNTVPKLGASTDTVSSCDTAVTSSWTSAYDATTGGYEVGNYVIGAGGTLNGVACAGATLKVTLADGTGAALGAEKTYTILAADTSHTFDFSADNIPAASVVKTNIVIVGP